MERFKSSPPLPGIYSSIPCALMLSTILQYIHMKFHIIVLMSNLGCADEEAGEDRSDMEHNPTPSTDTQTGNPRGARWAVRKRRSSSQTTSNR